ncbi:MAG TPA: hypothetical protein VFK65_23765, partial [Candidatus Binatia bacterium]|nr:hypothetical protein [Candidatus Binatia bacterium]
KGFYIISFCMLIWLTGRAQYFTISPLNSPGRGWKGGLDEGAHFAKRIEIVGGGFLGVMW